MNMKFLIFCLIAFAASYSMAHARDSFWMVGSNDHIAVNIFEHRHSPGRITDVTLIFGDWLLAGSVEDTDAEISNPVSITLKEGNGNFKGTIVYSASKTYVKLEGKLTLYGSTSNLDETVTCKEMHPSNLQSKNN